MNGRTLPTGPGRLSVHVLATTAEGTRRALTTAKQLTGGVDAHVVLLVPKLKSFSLPFNPASDVGAVLIDEHRALAASIGVHVTVLFCVCQRYDDVVHQLLSQSSLLVVGGRKRVWWPSREERLVSRLLAEGYPVVFAQVGAVPATARAPVMAS